MYSSAQNSGFESGYEDVATGRLKSSRRTRRPQAYGKIRDEAILLLSVISSIYNLAMNYSSNDVLSKI